MKSEFASILITLLAIKKSPGRRLQTRRVFKCGWKLVAALAILVAGSGPIAPGRLEAQSTTPPAPNTAQLQVLPSPPILFAGGGTCNSSFLPASGPAVGAPFCNTAAAVEDSNGNTYIVDSIYNCVYKVDPSGNYSVYAGICMPSASSGYQANGYLGDGGPAIDALLSQPMDAVVDGNDNLYIADTLNNVIRVVNAETGIINTYAGNGQFPDTFWGGGALLSNLDGPLGLTFDPAGNLYFSTGDQGDFVGKVDTSGNVSLFAGTQPGSFNPNPGYSGDGGPAAGAGLDDPTGLASDAAGNIYIGDSRNQVIRKVDTQGIITTVAGGGTGVGDGGPATDAAINPFGVATDLAGDLYVSSPDAVRKVDTTGIISTFITGIGLDLGRVDHNGNLILPAGDPLIRSAPSGKVFTAGASGALDFGVQAPNTTSAPQTVTLENSGNATLQFSSISGANFGNGSGIITANFAIAPGGTCTYTTLSPGASCTLNVTFKPTYLGPFSGTITLNSNAPNAPAIIQLSGTGANPGTPVAVISPPVLYFDGVIGTTSAAQYAVLSNVGSATLTINGISIIGVGVDYYAFAITTGANSCANSLAPGASCNIYATFTGASAGTFKAGVWVSDNDTASPHSGFGLSDTSVAPPVPNAVLTPSSIDFGSQPRGSSTTKTIVLTNTGTAPLTTIGVWFLNGTDMTDFSLTNLASPCPAPLRPGGTCSIGVIFQPVSAGSFSGMLRVTDDAANSPQTAPLTGIGTEEQVQIEPSLLNVYAGNSSSNGPPAAGPAVGAYIGNAGAVVQDLHWNNSITFSFSETYIVDTKYNSVYQVDPGGNLTLYAGVPTTGAGGFSGDNGPADAATLAQPRDVAIDRAGNPYFGEGGLYIADSANNRIRLVRPYAPYVIDTYAGNGDPGALTAGPKTGVPIGQPNGLTFDPDSNLYFTSGNLVGKIDGSGTISIFAGTTSAQGNGVAGYSGDGGPATSATLSNPQGLASDLAGNIYIADSGNFVVRKVDTNGNISTVAGNHNQGNSGDGGMATDAEINAVGVSTDRAGELYITGGGTNPIRKVNSAGMISTFAGGGSGGASGPAPGASLPNVQFARPDRFGNLLIPSGATVFSAGSEGILQFGNQGAGTTSAPETITLTNIGNGTVDFTSLSNSNFGNGSGAITGDFSIAPGGTCTYATLDPGASCTINVAFAPQSVASLTGTITLGTNAQGGDSTVQLSGTGVAQPQAALAPATLTFTAVSGSTSATQSVTLSNTGNATLAIDSVQIVGANASNFAVTTGSNACGTTLTASSTCNIYVDFTPSSVAGFAATLSVADNASGSPHTVSLAGTGTGADLTPQAALAPAILTFTAVSGSTSATQSVTLSNTGNATLAIDSIQIVGANASNFAVTTGSNACGTTVTASSTCNIYLAFTPSSVAGFAATLSVADNASGSPHTASLAGTGTTPPNFTISAAPALLTVATGSAGSYTVTIAPSGSQFSTAVALSISGLQAGVTGSFSPQSVTPSSGSVTSQLTIKVPARSALNRTPWFLAGPALALFLLWPMRRLRRFWRANLLPMMIVAAALGAAVLVSGCGGGPGSTTPPTTYNLMITGTSGTDVHSTSVQLAVK